MADLEADRLRALMRAAVFKQPHQPVLLGRYEIVKVLGSGAMGIVYEAFDPRRGEHVALKTLRAPSARGLSLFKREFRALSRISHPNLVALYEMGRDHDQYFFTMELVRGSPLVGYLWGVETSPEGRTATPVTDFARLRAVFAQLVDGVFALHQTHKLHRDIKPTNVMVSPEGRVVLMDFGFVGEESVGTLESTAGSLVVGTPAYMAPEQAAGGARTPASDWYSVGATLYMALSGQVPFAGDNLARMMERKQLELPPPPRALVAGIPDDLDAICLRMLHPDPKARPSAGEILAFFHGDRSLIQRVQAAYASPAATHVGARSFVGRAAEVRALRLAYDAVEQFGRPALVLVRGRAGLGKSALCRHVTDGLRTRAALLRARCYERDTVPYKALDSLVDALARQLRQRDEAEVRAVLPPETDALVALFPVLHQAPAVAAIAPAPAPIPQKRDLRTALRPDTPAFRALRSLLHDLGARRPLVLWIDDLQWGDADSVRALAELLRPPEAPRALLIASFRGEDDGSPALRTLNVLEDMAQRSGFAVHVLDLQPLGPDETDALAEILLGPETPPPRVRRIAAEAGGSPQLLHELARFVAHGAGSAPEVTLDELIEIRISRLTPAQRRLLEVLAVAGGPLSQRLALDVAGAGAGNARPGLADLQQLQGAGLVRSWTNSDIGDVSLDVHHERARDAVLVRLDGPALRDLHARLAAALERDPHTDPLALIEHLRAADEPARALALARRAAEFFADAGEHLRAAGFYRVARDLAPPGGAAPIARALGDALARAGHARAAADAYLSARAGTDPLADLALAGLAAAQLAAAGHLARGQQVLTEALVAAGIPTGESSVRARLGALWRRGQKKVRGLDFTPRAEPDIPRVDLVRLDLCFAAALAAVLTDPGSAFDAQSRHLLLALRTGEPYRVGRAFALEGALLATGSDTGRAQLAPLLASARTFARPPVGDTGADDPGPGLPPPARPADPARLRADALADLCDLIELLAETLAGDPARAITRAAPLIRTAGRHAPELPGLVTLAQLCRLRALELLGRYDLLRQQLPELLAAARAADDRAAQVAYAAQAAWVAAVHGDTDDARAHAGACAAAWPAHDGRDFHRQHLQILAAEAHARLAARDPLGAWTLVDAATPALARSNLGRLQPLRLQAADLTGRVALAALCAGVASPAVSASRSLAGEGPRRALEQAAEALQQGGAGGHAALLRAGLRGLHGDLAGAANLLQAARESFHAAGLVAHATVAALRLAQLTGGDEGPPRAALQALGVPRPDLLAALLAPAPAG